MTLTVEIDGTPVSIQDRSLVITDTIGSSVTLAAVIRSMDGSYRPAIGDDIEVTQDATVIFGGTIEHVSERSADNAVSLSAIDTAITAVDYRGLAARRVVLTTRSSETLKARITYLATLLNTVTVHAFTSTPSSSVGNTRHRGSKGASSGL